MSIRHVIVMLALALAAGAPSLAQSLSRAACEDVALALSVLSLGGVAYAVVDAGVFETPHQYALLESMWRQLHGLNDTPQEVSVPYGIIHNWAVPAGAVEVFASRAGLACLLLAIPAPPPGREGS